MKHILIVFLCVIGLQTASPLIAQTDSTGKHAASTLDERLFLSINHWGETSPGLDGTMKFLSNTAAYPLVAVPLGIYLYGVERGDRATAMAGASIAISEAVSGLLTQGLKLAVQRERPYHVLLDVRLPGTPSGGYSMPSGHSTGAWSLATSLSLHYPTLPVIIPSALYAIAVSLSRPYLGVHYPSDLLVGALIGAGTSYLVYRFEDKIMSGLTWALPHGDGSQKMIFFPGLQQNGAGVQLIVNF